MERFTDLPLKSIYVLLMTPNLLLTSAFITMIWSYNNIFDFTFTVQRIIVWQFFFFQVVMLRVIH